MTDAATPRPVLVVDFGAQYAQLIARRVREAQMYSEVIAHDAPIAQFREKNPAALVLTGGPSSVYADGAPSLQPELLELGVPVFGICYGFQAMTHALGGTVAQTGKREYGRTDLTLADGCGVLHEGLAETHKVWMSHGDSVSKAPEGFDVTATSEVRRWRRSSAWKRRWPVCSTTLRCCTARMVSKCWSVFDAGCGLAADVDPGCYCGVFGG